MSLVNPPKLLDKFEAVSPNELVDFLIARKSVLTREVKQRLRDNFGTDHSPDHIGGKEDFDLHAEVVEQLKAVRALRKSAICSNGTLNTGIRDAKEAVSTSTSLLTLLTKMQGEIYNQNRIRYHEYRPA